MTLQPGFNFLPVRADAEEGRTLPNYIIWANKMLSRLAGQLKGPQSRALTVTTTEALNPALVDLSLITLAGNATITLDMRDTRTATIAYLELTQDATGGRTVTWVNALTTPAISATAHKRTLLLAVRNADGWVLTTLASGY